MLSGRKEGFPRRGLNRVQTVQEGPCHPEPAQRAKDPLSGFVAAGTVSQTHSGGGFLAFGWE
jgi:hypothetical protein